MKKIPFIFSVLIVMGMLLSACGGAPNPGGPMVQPASEVVNIDGVSYQLKKVAGNPVHQWVRTTPITEEELTSAGADWGISPDDEVWILTLDASAWGVNADDKFQINVDSFGGVDDSQLATVDQATAWPCVGVNAEKALAMATHMGKHFMAHPLGGELFTMLFAELLAGTVVPEIVGTNAKDPSQVTEVVLKITYMGQKILVFVGENGRTAFAKATGEQVKSALVGLIKRSGSAKDVVVVMSTLVRDFFLCVKTMWPKTPADIQRSKDLNKTYYKRDPGTQPNPFPSFPEVETEAEPTVEELLGAEETEPEIKAMDPEEAATLIGVGIIIVVVIVAPPTALAAPALPTFALVFANSVR